MIGLHNLTPARGARHRRKIVGRGEGSGHGGSATRGMKGQRARSGEGKSPGFEGGQMPLMRRIPKRGFTSRNRISYEPVNVEMLEKHFSAGVAVTPEALREQGIIKRKNPVKVLGTGTLTKALTVTAAAFSKSALDKIKAAGGTAVVAK